MYFSSEEEINDDVSSDEDDKQHPDASTKQKKPFVHLDKIELSEIDKKRIATQRGIISLSFPEKKKPQFEGQITFPRSYYTVSSKERLLLLFAENFRRQYNFAYDKRKPLLLAVENECGVQKFVSTTIRNTALLFAEMIGCWEGPAQFVADFIEFEPLTEPVLLPNRLISPDSLLRRRKGNSFEMATLLCSLLIGNGFQAMVVSGYASREVVTNNQERVDCLFVPQKEETDQNKGDLIEKPVNKYSLRDPIDLRSKFEIEVAERKARDLAEAHQIELERKQHERELEEQLELDPFHGCRVHAWVVIIPRKKAEHEEEVFFIEPSTGFRVNVNDNGYLGVESVWNEQNYYVNCQEPITGVSSMKWDFENVHQWQALLLNPTVDTSFDSGVPIEGHQKYLDMPHSWVNRLHIGNVEFDEKFPNGMKIIRYKRAIYERFANYFNKNGLVKRLTLYETLNYEGELTKWEWYENREDLLNMTKTDYITNQTEENFSKGRADNLKRHTQIDVKSCILNFYSRSRIDALHTLDIAPSYIRENFDRRDDRLISREFKREYDVLVSVCEKFQRDPKLSAKNDIEVRTFDLVSGKIRLQYHYGEDEITPTIRVFKRPAEPEYGCEIIYNWQDPETNQFNKKEHLSRVEQYLLLLRQLRDEEICKCQYERRVDAIRNIFELRERETLESVLKFSIFDALRNSAARSSRLAKQEHLERRKELALRSEPDFLAPYLVRYSNRVPTNSESVAIMNACLNDIEKEYVYILNELQRLFEDQVAEEQSLQRFLNRFQEQFEDFEYEALVKQGERIESSKKIYHQRIESIEQEFREKYDNIRTALLGDSRLNFYEEGSNSSDVGTKSSV